VGSTSHLLRTFGEKPRLGAAGRVGEKVALISVTRLKKRNSHALGEKDDQQARKEHQDISSGKPKRKTTSRQVRLRLAAAQPDLCEEESQSKGSGF
jgi:hypothetical protein